MNANLRTVAWAVLLVVLATASTVSADNIVNGFFNNGLNGWIERPFV